MLSEAVRSRLSNWKFEQACVEMQRQLEDPAVGNPTESERKTIDALAMSFGNSGCFYGYLADVVRAAVWSLGVYE